MLGHTVRVVLGYEFESLDELSATHDLHLFLHRTDNVLELVENDESSVTIFRVFNNLMCNRSSYIKLDGPVGKFMGVLMLVMAESMMSVIDLLKATDPLSPTTNIL